MTNSFDTRMDFESTWLFESPEGTSPKDYSGAVDQNIRDVIQFLRSIGKDAIALGNNLFKIELNQVVYYWYEVNNQMQIGVEFTKKPQGLIVNMIGKYNRGQPPWASDLYSAVLADRHNQNFSIDCIRIMSDSQLSEEGLGIWENLLNHGHKIMVYDSERPGESQVRITTIGELHSFFRMKDPSYRRYQYVLSESESFADLIAVFNLRKIREINDVV